MSRILTGIYLASYDTPICTSMGRYHPDGAPDDYRLGPADDPQTWFDAYHMIGNVKEARELVLRDARDVMEREAESDAELAAEADDEPDEDDDYVPHVGDFMASAYAATVDETGRLVIADWPLDLEKLLDDLDPQDLFAVTAMQHGTITFSRDEVYASYGAEPRFAADEEPDGP